ncbi:MAG: glycoside hydrolase family 16 protein [Fibrobacterales bacterium]
MKYIFLLSVTFLLLHCSTEPESTTNNSTIPESLISEMEKAYNTNISEIEVTFYNKSDSSELFSKWYDVESGRDVTIEEDSLDGIPFYREVTGYRSTNNSSEQNNSSNSKEPNESSDYSDAQDPNSSDDEPVSDSSLSSNNQQSSDEEPIESDDTQSSDTDTPKDSSDDTDLRPLLEYELFHFERTFTDFGFGGGCESDPTPCPITFENGIYTWDYNGPDLPAKQQWGGIMITEFWDEVTESPQGHSTLGATSIKFEARSPTGGSVKFVSGVHDDASITIANISSDWEEYSIALPDDFSYDFIDMALSVWLEGTDEKTIEFRNVQYSSDPAISMWVEDFLENFDDANSSLTTWDGGPSTSFYREPAKNAGYGGMGEQNNLTESTNNSRVEDGKLKIINTIDGGTINSARIISTKQYTYGKFEAKIKMPTGPNGVMDGASWPSFWLLGQDSDKGCLREHWPSCGEIDIVEAGGAKPNDVYGTNHWGKDAWDNKADHGDSYTHSEPINKAFHTYTLIWSPNKISMLFNGEKYFSMDLTGYLADGTYFDIRGYFAFKMEIILLNTVGSVGGLFYGIHSGIVDHANYPQVMEIDYVGRWKRWNDKWAYEGW